MNKKIQAKAGITGRMKTSIFDMRSQVAQKLELELERHAQQIPTFEKIAKEKLGIGKRLILNLPINIQPILKQEEKILLAVELEKRQAKHWKIYKEIVAELSRLFKVREYEVTNLIALVGRSVIAQRLANTTTYTGIINYGSLGSSSTAPASSDTTLGTEVFRKTVASASYTDHQAFVDFFYSKSDTNGTYEEFGTVIDGTASADTGQLFTHALTGGWTKTSSESMTVAAQYDVNYQT